MNKIKKFFTHKNYFFQRHSLVVGVVLVYYICHYYGHPIIEKWTDIFGVLLVAYIIGIFFNAFTYAIADVFCKDKFIDEIMKDD